ALLACVVLLACMAEGLVLPAAGRNQAAASKPDFARSDRLKALVDNCVAAATARFGKKGLGPDKIAITVIDVSDPAHPLWASHRGEAGTYPASVVKLFYLAAAHHQIETGALKETPELDRALHDMIVSSSNDATHYVVDVLTGTTAGPDLADLVLG